MDDEQRGRAAADILFDRLTSHVHPDLIVSELVNLGLVDTESQAKAAVLYVTEFLLAASDMRSDIETRYSHLTPEQRNDFFRVLFSGVAEDAGIRVSAGKRHGIDPDCLTTLIAYGVLILVVGGVAVFLWWLFT